MSTGPQLSSLATSLNELTERLTEVTESLEGERREELAASLYEVERSLLAAGRRLERIVDELI